LSRRITSLVAVAALALSFIAIAGCGGGDNNDNGTTAGTTATTSTTETTTTPSGGGGSNLKISADPSGSLKFTKSSLNAKSGKVTITMDNPSPVQHAVAIEGNGVDVSGNTVGKGGVSTVTANLKPGKYEFYCPVDGHKDAGMEGKLTVK
jgi:uncharacterized cupredoxin-like copper-binding protein